MPKMVTKRQMKLGRLHNRIQLQPQKNRQTAFNAAHNVNPSAASAAERQAEANSALAETHKNNAIAARDKARTAKSKSEGETQRKRQLRNNVQSKLTNAKNDNSETLSALKDAEADFKVKRGSADIAFEATERLKPIMESAARVYNEAKKIVDTAAKTAQKSVENAEKTVSEQNKIECIIECNSKTREQSMNVCLEHRCGVSLMSDVAVDASDKVIQNQGTYTTTLTTTLTGPNGTDNLTNGTDNLTNGTDTNLTVPNVTDTDNFTVEVAAKFVKVNADAAVEAAISIDPASHTEWYLDGAVRIRVFIESKNALLPQDMKAAEEVGVLADKAMKIADDSWEKMDSARSFLATAESALKDLDESSKSLTLTNDQAQQALTEAEKEMKALNTTAAGQKDTIKEIESELTSLGRDVMKSVGFTNTAKDFAAKAENARRATEVASNTATDEASRAGRCREEAQRREDCYNRCDGKDFLACKIAFRKDKCKERHQRICKLYECRNRSC